MVAGTGGRTTLYSTADWTSAGDLEEHNGDGVTVLFEPASRWFATSLGEATRIWSLPDVRLIADLSHGGYAVAAALSDDGRRLAIGDADGQVEVWTPEV